MARSAKTKHVMNLVSAKKPPVHPAKPSSAEMTRRTPNVPRVLEYREVPQAQPAQAQPVPQGEAQVMSKTASSQKADSVQEKPPVAEENEPVTKNKITAIVCELINQELGSVAERFRLKPTDSNLWELTKAALEDVRPEFSADGKETEKKLERLRPQVIAAMAKAAIKVSSKSRNS